MKNTNLSASERLVLIGSIGTMLKAGIPILEAVESMLTDAKKNQKIVLETLRSDLSQGKQISASFARFPKAFTPVVVNLIKAAEEAGTLDATLNDLTISEKKEIEFTSKVKGALTYPLVVVAIFFVVVLLLLYFVIPRISTAFTRLRTELPLPTKILINISNFFVGNTIYIIIGTVIALAVLIFLYKSQKKKLLNMVYSLPLLSTLAKQIDITRFSRSMALLLSSGIPINDALELSTNVVTKKELMETFIDSRRQVIAGKKLSDGLKKNKDLIPQTMIRIVEAGEKSGTLDKSMQEIADYYDSQVSDTLRSLTTLLEPLLLVVIGVIVGGVMLAIIAPIYNILGKISAH